MPRFGTGGGVLLRLGRLTSEEMTEREEPESKEAELIDREGPTAAAAAETAMWAGLEEDSLTDTSGSLRCRFLCFSGGGGVTGAALRG